MAEMDKALEMLSEMLSTDEGQKKLEGVIDMFAKGGTSTKKEESNDFNPEKLMAIASLFGGMGEPDDRVNLLYALKPYLSSKRVTNVDMAAKLLSMGKLPKILKELQ